MPKARAEAGRPSGPRAYPSGRPPTPPTSERQAYVFELPEKVEEILDVVERIPEGKVLTYGDVAELVGQRGPRFVGNVMSRFGSEVPWWRVVRAGGWPPRGLEDQARPHYLEEGTPMVRGALDGLRVDLLQARWDGLDG